jgi:hypothetical protein
MSGQLTQFGANRAAKAGVGDTVTATSGMYIALATAEPAGPDTATLADFAADEIDTAGYQRQAVTWDAPSGDPSNVQNSALLEFGPFSADPPEVGYVFLCDTSIGTSGNVMAYWTVDVPRDAGIADTLRIAAGDLDLSVD